MAPNYLNPNGGTVVQFYEDEGAARVFFDDANPWDIAPPPTGRLTPAALTRVMAVFRYRPVGRWKQTDWGMQRNFARSSSTRRTT